MATTVNNAQTNDAQKDIAQNDGIGGFNSMLNQHKKGEGLCRLTTIFFSDNAKIIHDRVDISTVKPLTAADYIPGGCTALLDTVGNAISHTKAIQAGASADTRANKVVFVIITEYKGYPSRCFRRHSRQQGGLCDNHRWLRKRFPRVQRAANQADDYSAAGQGRLGFHLPRRKYRCCADCFVIRHPQQYVGKYRC